MTIEERANNIADAHGYIGLARQHIIEACVEIATEQKAIDIDKACEWIINTYLGDYVTDEDGNGGIGDNVKLAEDFKKAMEKISAI